MDKLLIIHFSQDFTYGKPQLGGYGRILNTLDSNQRHIIYTVSSEDKVEKRIFFVANGFEVRQVPAYISKGSLIDRIKSIKKISSLISKDIIEFGLVPTIFFGHSQLPNFFILNRVKTTLKLSTPIIWEFNAIWGGINVMTLKNRIAIQIMRYFERKIVKNADALIFQTSTAKNWIKTLYGKAKGKQLIVTNAVTLNSLNEEKLIIKPSSPPKILVNGLFDSMNGLGIIVGYLNRYNDCPVELHFFGSGPWSDELERIADGEKVFFHGSVPRDVMEKEYLNFDYHLIPRLKSVEADLFIPSKLLEAMGKGLVPIVSKVGGMIDVVSEDEGYLIEPGNIDELNLIFKEIQFLNKEEWLKRSEKCKFKIKNDYQWVDNHKKLSNLYNELIT